MGRIGWGGPSTGPCPLFIVVVSSCRCEPLRASCCGGRGVYTDPTPPFIVVVSPCRCEPLRAGCCGGGGVLDVLQG